MNHLKPMLFVRGINHYSVFDLLSEEKIVSAKPRCEKKKQYIREARQSVIHGIAASLGSSQIKISSLTTILHFSSPQLQPNKQRFPTDQYATPATGLNRALPEKKKKNPK